MPRGTRFLPVASAVVVTAVALASMGLSRSIFASPGPPPAPAAAVLIDCDEQVVNSATVKATPRGVKVMTSATARTELVLESGGWSITRSLSRGGSEQYLSAYPGRGSITCGSARWVVTVVDPGEHWRGPSRACASVGDLWTSDGHLTTTASDLVGVVGSNAEGDWEGAEVKQVGYELAEQPLFLVRTRGRVALVETVGGYGVLVPVRVRPCRSFAYGRAD
jgi:hypothetical protein